MCRYASFRSFASVTSWSVLRLLSRSSRVAISILCNAHSANGLPMLIREIVPITGATIFRKQNFGKSIVLVQVQRRSSWIIFVIILQPVSDPFVVKNTSRNASRRGCLCLKMNENFRPRLRYNYLSLPLEAGFLTILQFRFSVTNPFAVQIRNKQKPPNPSAFPKLVVKELIEPYEQCKHWNSGHGRCRNA